MISFKEYITELSKLDRSMWMDRSGKIIDLGTNFHIQDIVKNPKKYKLTSQEIEKIYDKHNEQVGREGEARLEIITDLIKRGWIHIKFVVAGQHSGWSITVQKLDNRTKDKLFNWSHDKLITSVDRFADVAIVELRNNRTSRFSLDQIQSGDF